MVRVRSLHFSFGRSPGAILLAREGKKPINYLPLVRVLQSDPDVSKLQVV